MNLIKEHWSEKDIPNFQNYLSSLSKGEEKAKWEQKIVNTSLPCIAVSSKDVKHIVSQISKGNFIEFIDLWIWENFTNTTIIGNLICKIKDFQVMKKYLTKYSQRVDSWASTDTIKFKVKQPKEYISFAKELCKSKYIFSRRLGIILLLKYINDESINEILWQLNQFENEKEYYVNMALAWLFAECFTKQRQKTLLFLKNNKLNSFVINKGISKCRDSFRITKEDKEMLLKYKK